MKGPVLTDLQIYFDRIEGRISVLEADSLTIENEMASRDERLLEHYENTSAKLNRIRGEIANLNSDIKNMMHTIKIVIGSLKQTVKKDVFNAFQEKVDDWSPETFISRETAKRMIKEAKND